MPKNTDEAYRRNLCLLRHFSPHVANKNQTKEITWTAKTVAHKQAIISPTKCQKKMVKMKMSLYKGSTSIASLFRDVMYFRLASPPPPPPKTSSSSLKITAGPSSRTSFMAYFESHAIYLRLPLYSPTTFKGEGP